MRIEGKKKFMYGIAGLAFLMGSGLALAQQKIDWDGNPEAGLTAELTEQMPGKSIRQENTEAEQIRLYAQGSAKTSHEDRFRGPTLSLVLNNDKDRVAISYTVCKNDVEWESCDTQRFVVDKLSYDPQTRKVLLGKQVIATNYRFWGMTLEKGIKLGYDISTGKEDTGFDRYNVSRVRVYLEGKLEL